MVRFPKLLCLALGAASALGFAPLGWWPITLIALAVFMGLIEKSPTLKSACGRGYWFGVGHFVVGLNWIAGSFRYQTEMPVWIGGFAVVGLALFLALYLALAAGAAWRYGKGVPRSFTLLFAAAWICAEMLRATLFTGFAWNPLGVAFIMAASPATLLGTYGLSGLVILCAGAVWMASQKKFEPAFWVMVAVAAIWGVGFWHQVEWGHQLTHGPAAKVTGSDFAVRVIQPNIGQQDKYEASFDETNFAKLKELTGSPGQERRLILWPEAAIPDHLEEEEWARERVAKLLGPKDLLLTGGDKLLFDKDERITGAHNSVFALTPGAQIVGRYDKAHLVPGGEYLPLRWLMEPLGATRLVPGDIDFHEGPGPRSFDLRKFGFGRVGIQLCYEIIFSGHVVDPRPYARPDFIFNPSNDAWFGSWGPPQHLAQARLRAVEEGLPVVRSTPTGITAIIDANGQVQNALRSGTSGAIEASLPAPHAPTLFARYGNLLPLLFAFLLTLIGIASRRSVV